MSLRRVVHWVNQIFNYLATRGGSHVQWIKNILSVTLFRSPQSSGSRYRDKRTILIHRYQLFTLLYVWHATVIIYRVIHYFRNHREKKPHKLRKRLMGMCNLWKIASLFFIKQHIKHLFLFSCELGSVLQVGKRSKEPVVLTWHSFYTWKLKLMTIIRVCLCDK